ncbi:MAG: 30S ribosomal protein S20 [Candidatus Omnitrophica bacterium]|nr:30S ribosomal protein S20 [Candidatus Omnitrophota bacterium]
MANRRQAIKKIRVDRRRTERNRAVQSQVKTFARKLNAFLAQKNYEEAAKTAPLLFSKLDKAVKKGALHPNNASRHKSRLQKKLNSLKQTPAPSTTQS